MKKYATRDQVITVLQRLSQTMSPDQLMKILELPMGQTVNGRYNLSCTMDQLATAVRHYIDKLLSNDDETIIVDSLPSSDSDEPVSQGGDFVRAVTRPNVEVDPFKKPEVPEGRKVTKSDVVNSMDRIEGLDELRAQIQQPIEQRITGATPVEDSTGLEYQHIRMPFDPGDENMFLGGDSYETMMAIEQRLKKWGVGRRHITEVYDIDSTSIYPRMIVQVPSFGLKMRIPSPLSSLNLDTTTLSSI